MVFGTESGLGSACGQSFLLSTLVGFSFHTDLQIKMTTYGCQRIEDPDAEVGTGEKVLEQC